MNNKKVGPGIESLNFNIYIKYLTFNKNIKIKLMKFEILRLKLWNRDNKKDQIKKNFK